MNTVVFHDGGGIRLDDVADPILQEPTDASIHLTASASCGTDLHFVRASVSGMTKGTILGHEGVGISEQLGSDARNLHVGDRVVHGEKLIDEAVEDSLAPPSDPESAARSAL